MNHWAEEMYANEEIIPQPDKTLCSACGSRAEQVYMMGRNGTRYCSDCLDWLIKCSVCGVYDFDRSYTGAIANYTCKGCITEKAFEKLKGPDTTPFLITFEEAVGIYNKANPQAERNRGYEYFRKYWGLGEKVPVLALIDTITKLSNGRTMAVVNKLTELHDGEKAVDYIIDLIRRQGLKCHDALSVDKQNKEDGMTYTVCHYDELTKETSVMVGFRSDIVSDPYGVF